MRRTTMRSTTNSMRGEIRVPVLGMRARGDAERRRHNGPRSSLTRAAALALGAVLSASIGVGSLHPTGANAGFPNQLPFMCFTTDHTFHQTFGPISFFLNENQQGTTSFQEAPPTSKPVVVLPLRRGTAAGHLVYYVITDASDLA